MKKVVLLTSNNLDGFITDEDLLEAELKKHEVDVCFKAWEDFEDEGEDLFIIRTTWNYTDHFDEFIKTLEPIQDRLWNPLPVIKWNANKQYLHDLYQKGLKVMPLSIVKDMFSLQLTLDMLGGDEFIVKPLVGAGAKGLVRFTRESMPTVSEPMIVQKFYPQIVDGEVSLFYCAGQYSHAVKKTPKAGEIRVQEEFGGLITPYQPTTEDRQTAESAVQEIPGEWLYARVDIVPGIGLIELECIEPAMYFSIYKDSAKPMAQAIIKMLE